MPFFRILFAVAVAVCFTVAGASAAAKAEPPAAKKAADTYDDPLGRSTPQGTFVGFLKAMEKGNEDRAVDYLDTYQTGKRAQQLAQELQKILDQGVSVSETSLSSKPEGNLNDGLPVNSEVVGVVKTSKGDFKILLERVRKENNPPIWLFSSETLKIIPEIYEELDVTWLERHLPAALTETRIAGWQLYFWLLPLVILPAALFLGWLCTLISFFLLREPLRRRFDEPTLAAFKGTRQPLMLLFTAGAVYVLSLGTVSLLGRLFWTFLASTLAVAGLTWILIRLIDVGAGIIERRQPAATYAVIRLSATLLKALVIVAGLVVIFYYFAGINLTAVFAGLGVGGLAVAFAAQKTIENFFGGVFLVWDKPIRVGDYCKAGEYEGTVEHIGLRSTQIRTINRTVVFIPNGQLSSISVENYTLRNRFLFRHTLNLRYETTADQLRLIAGEVRELLKTHPAVDDEGARVHFAALGASSLDVKIFAYVLETTYERFLAVQEELLLRIMDLVESCGGGFAFPSQTVYVNEDRKPDGDKALKAARTARRRKDQGELPFADGSLPESSTNDTPRD